MISLDKGDFCKYESTTDNKKCKVLVKRRVGNHNKLAVQETRPSARKHNAGLLTYFTLYNALPSRPFYVARPIAGYSWLFFSPSSSSC